MSKKRNIGIIIREQRKGIPLTLKQLSEVSSVSIAHLGRIENGQRMPSPRTLQKIATPLGFDLSELLIMAGYLSLDSSKFSEEHRNKIRAELSTLSERVARDSQRIREIVDRLLMSS